MSATENVTWREIEQPAGPPVVSGTVDPKGIDEHRRQTHQSYERFLRGQLEQLDRSRASRWTRDYSSVDAYLRSVEPMRQRLKEMLGFWVEPGQRPKLLRTAEEMLLDEREFTARRFRFEILPGLNTYAVELKPKSPGPHPGLIAQHGYGGTPELVCGLTPLANDEDYAYRSLGVRAAAKYGFHVIAVHHPSGYGTSDDVASGLPQFASHPVQYGKNRLHRMAVMAGGKTLFGLDMMGTSRGVDLLTQCADVDSNRIGMYGLSQGGQSTVFLPALDTRIRAAVASAWFNWRFPKLVGGTKATCYLDSLEEDKFFPDLVGLFSDSDVVSLICPRAFAVEAGLRDSSVDFEFAQREFEHARRHYDLLDSAQNIEFIAHQQGHVSATKRAMEFLVEKLG